MVKRQVIHVGHVTGDVDIDETALQSEFVRIGIPHANRVARDIRFEAKRLAPVRTGQLRESIQVRRAQVTGPWQISAEVVATRRYARYVHEGTAPHIIRARRAKALRFYWEKMGRIVFFKSVHHPGTKPQPFMAEAAAIVAARHRG